MNNSPHFDRYATSYDAALNSALSVTGDTSAYYAEARIALLHKIVSKIATRRVATILDFGCGTGSATPFFQRYFPKARIIGVDMSPESINVARQRFESEAATFHVLQSDKAENIRGVDLVFVNGVFHHIPPWERDSWLVWIHQKIITGGILALFENNPWNPGTRFVMSQCEFDDDAICLSQLETKRRMRKPGFQILAIRHLLFFPNFLRYFRPIEPFLSWIPLGGQYVCLGRK